MRGELRKACRLKPGQTSADCPAGTAGSDRGGRADVGDLQASGPAGREAYFDALAVREQHLATHPDDQFGATAAFERHLAPHLARLNAERAAKQARKDSTKMSKHSDCTCGGSRRADDIDDDDLAHRSALGETATPWTWTDLPPDADATEVKQRLATFGACEFPSAAAKKEAFDELLARLRELGFPALAIQYAAQYQGRLDHDLMTCERAAEDRARLRSAGVAVDGDRTDSYQPSVDDSEEVAAEKARLRHADLWARPSRFWSKP